MKRKAFYRIFAFLLLSFQFLQAQKQAVSLEDIWQRYTFFPASAEGFNYLKDSRFYTVSEGKSIYKYDTRTGKNLGLIAELPISFEEYEFNNQEDKILLLNARERIYRRSFRAEYFVYDLKTKQNKKLSNNGKPSYATFSPDGSKVAFVRDNNLYMVDLATMTETAITTNGKKK
jgi:dipeptidyl-peptidase-4